MKLRISVDYHPEYIGEFEPYIAKILEYPELQGYGDPPDKAIEDGLGFPEEHLGKALKILREEIALELDS